jgi:hypothetical protein
VIISKAGQGFLHHPSSRDWPSCSFCNRAVSLQTGRKIKRHPPATFNLSSRCRREHARVPARVLSVIDNNIEEAISIAVKSERYTKAAAYGMEGV